MLRVIAYTGGKSVPSARFRVRQYIPEMHAFGVELREVPAGFGSYPPASRVVRPLWAVAGITERIGAAIQSRAADVTLLQREMISTFVTAERFTKRPRVLDVDDAIWLLRGGNFARTLARLCDTVVCGNSFIADFFRQSAHRVVVLPTAVDTDRFCPTPEPKEYAPVICWSGTSSGLRYLKAIEKPLAAVLAQDARRRLRVISDLPPALRSLPAAQVEFVRWSEASEVTAIRDAALGIMPLEDSPWSRGKCGYKLLTYMACGLPVVATPLGFNADLLRGDKAGLSAWTPSQWAEAIDCLLSSPERASAMGAAGCRLVRNEFSLKALAPQFARILHSAARN